MTDCFEHVDSFEFDDHEKANRVIDCMLLKLVPISVPIVLSLLQACTRRKDLATGRRLHALSINTELSSLAILRDEFVRMFASCGCLLEANLVFCKSFKPSAWTWQAIIIAHVSLGENERALKLYEEMQVEVSSPGKYVYSSMLKACSSTGALRQGKQIHHNLIKSELHSDTVVGNSLIDMYAKCGSLSEAFKVFNDFPQRNVVTFNAMMCGYAEHYHDLHAVELYDEMQQEGTCPDCVTYSCLLKACGNAKALLRGKQLHGQVIAGGIDLDIVVGSSLIDMYSKCSNLALAHEAFNSLPHRSIVSWNSLITGYAEHGYGYIAMELFEKMQKDEVAPNKVTFLCLLKACKNEHCIERGAYVHQHIVHNGLQLDPTLGNALVDMYCKCRNFELAHKVFCQLPNKCVVSWSSLISGYLEHGQHHSALACFDEMQQAGIHLDRVTIICALKACSNLEVVEKGKLVHEQVIGLGLDFELTVGNTLLDMYAKCGCLSEAKKVFDMLKIHDVVSCNAMIAAYTQFGHGLHALEILNVMGQDGIQPDKVTFLCTCQACGSIGAIGQGKLLHVQIVKNGVDTDVVVGTTLIDMYAKCGSLDDAYTVFYKLPGRNLVCWSAMFTAFAEHGSYFLLLQCLNEMQLHGLNPDGKIYTILLMACSHAGKVEEGYYFFRVMSGQHVIAPTLEHFSCLVDLLSRCGHLEDAQKLLQTMPVSPDLSEWMCLLTGCNTFGDIHTGIDCFDRVNAPDLFHASG